MSESGALDDPAANWYRLAALLRLCGFASEVDRQGQDPVELLEQIGQTEAMLRVRLVNPKIQDPRTLWRATRNLFRDIRTHLDLPVPRSLPDQQAILCWSLHVGDGWTLAEIGRAFQVRVKGTDSNDYVTPAWADGKATTYERMWIAGEPKSSNVTIRALGGLIYLADLWSVAMGIDLNLLQPAPPTQKVERPGPVQRPEPGDESTFVEDVTIPDGSIMKPGEPFTKTWRLRNTGTVSWRGRFLSRVGVGDGVSMPKSPPKVEISDTGPGETVDISVKMVAPTSQGQTKVTFKMTDEFGQLYFPSPEYSYGIYCEIIVHEKSSRLGWFSRKR